MAGRRVLGWAGLAALAAAVLAPSWFIRMDMSHVIGVGGKDARLVELYVGTVEVIALIAAGLGALLGLCLAAAYFWKMAHGR
jgi:hypothetical protein